MKITRARIYVVKGGGLQPVLLELTTDNGIIGLGEAGVAYGAGQSAAAACIEEMCSRYIMGEHPFAIEGLVSRMYDFSFWSKNGGALMTAAMSAIELALYDIKARALNVPAYELFGGEVRRHVPLYVNGWYFGCKSDAELSTAASNTVDDGYSALKMYPFAEILPNGTLRHPSRRCSDDVDAVNKALKRVESVRTAIGAEPRLMLDLSGGLTISDTIGFCKSVEQFDITFIEEPVDPSDSNGLDQIAHYTSIPLAVGERLYTRAEFRDVLENRSVGIVQPDLGNTGGIAEAKKIAAMAESYSVKVQPHICGSSLASAIGIHFATCTSNFYLLEHFPYWHRVEGFIEVAANPPDQHLMDGKLPILSTPGYGIDLDYDAVSPWLFADMTCE